MGKIFDQYNELKKMYSTNILLFRCGDFYETYEDDAEACAKVLGLALTKNPKTGVRMTGFPHIALDIYLPKLVRAGKRVCIVDEKELTDFKAEGDGFVFTQKKINSNSINNSKTSNIMEKKFRVIRSASSAYMFIKEMQALMEVKLERVEYDIETGKATHTWVIANTDKKVMTSYLPATETEPEQFTGKFYKTLESFEKGEAMTIDAIFYGLEDEQGLCGRLCRNVKSDTQGAYFWAYENGEAVKWYFNKHIAIIQTVVVEKGSWQWSADKEIPESYWSSEDVYKYNDYRFVDADGKEEVREGFYKRLFLEPDQKVLAEKLQAVIDECKEAGMCVYWNNASYDLNAVNVRHVDRIEYEPDVDEETERRYDFEDYRAAHAFGNVAEYNSENGEVFIVVKK